MGVVSLRKQYSPLRVWLADLCIGIGLVGVTSLHSASGATSERKQPSWPVVRLAGRLLDLESSHRTVRKNVFGWIQETSTNIERQASIANGVVAKDGAFMEWFRRLSPSPSAADWKLSQLAAGHRGSCLATVTGALLVGRCLGLRSAAVAVPDHLLLQVEVAGRRRWFDLVEGTREFDSASARGLFKIPSSSEAFLRPLSDDELVACFRIERAAEFIESGNLRAAVRDLHRALRDFPTHPSGSYNLGLVQLKRGHWSLAERLFSQAIALNSNDARPRFNRAFSLWKQARRDEAMVDVLEALRLSPGMREAIGLRNELSGDQ